jgi:hypothetical protein
MIAKIGATAAAAENTIAPGFDADASSAAGESTERSSSSGSSATESSSSSSAKATSGDEPESHPGDSKEPKEPKGHGRNGASAYRQAQHVLHALALGVIGALCAACRLAKMYRYREKIVVRIIGRPMFGAKVHHLEQARCRGCGHIVRAQGPDDVCQGLGTDYVRYDWSACAMLMVMPYFGGAPVQAHRVPARGMGRPDARREPVGAGQRRRRSPAAAVHAMLFGAVTKAKSVMRPPQFGQEWTSNESRHGRSASRSR